MSTVSAQHTLKEVQRAHRWQRGASQPDVERPAAPSNKRLVWALSKKRRHRSRTTSFTEYARQALPICRGSMRRDPLTPKSVHDKRVLKQCHHDWRQLPAREKEIWRVRSRARLREQQELADPLETYARSSTDPGDKTMKGIWQLGDACNPVAPELFEKLSKERYGLSASSHQSFIRAHAEVWRDSFGYPTCSEQTIPKATARRTCLEELQQRASALTARPMRHQMTLPKALLGSCAMLWLLLLGKLATSLGDLRKQEKLHAF